MLRLTRNVGASLRIGDDVEVKVLGFEADGSVRIGIDAPREKKVNRLEVHRNRNGENYLLFNPLSMNKLWQAAKNYRDSCKKARVTETNGDIDILRQRLFEAVDEAESN